MKEVMIMLGNNLQQGMDFDTVSEAELNAPEGVASATRGSKDTKIDQLQSIGSSAYNAMSEQEKAVARSKSETLKFLGFAVLNGKQTESRARKDANGNSVRVKAAKDVGLVFVSDEAITVPLIDVRHGFKTVVTADQIQERQIAAGQNFILTKLEAMYLLARVEYSGHFVSDNGECYMNINTSKYGKENAIPTPTFNGVGFAIHDLVIAIDTQKGDGTWAINESEPEAQRFSVYYEVRKAQRGGSGNGTKAPSVDKPTIVAAALRNILGI